MLTIIGVCWHRLVAKYKSWRHSYCDGITILRPFIIRWLNNQCCGRMDICCNSVVYLLFMRTPRSLIHCFVCSVNLFYNLKIGIWYDLHAYNVRRNGMCVYVCVSLCKSVCVQCCYNIPHTVWLLLILFLLRLLTFPPKWFHDVCITAKLCCYSVAWLQR